MQHEDVMEIIFDCSQHNIHYVAGQFISVRIMDYPKQNRAYTISGFDHKTKHLRITVKRVENGFGTGIIFDTFKVGQSIVLDDPMGHDLIVDKNSERMIFVAAGIGITPFIPIIEELKESHYAGEVILVYGARTKKELYYFEDINTLMKDEPKMSFLPVLSRDKEHKGYKGYVTDVIKDLDLDNSKIYMCAAPKVAEGVAKVLAEKKFDEKDFFVESA